MFVIVSAIVAKQCIEEFCRPFQQFWGSCGQQCLSEIAQFDCFGWDALSDRLPLTTQVKHDSALHQSQSSGLKNRSFPINPSLSLSVSNHQSTNFTEDRGTESLYNSGNPWNKIALSFGNETFFSHNLPERVRHWILEARKTARKVDCAMLTARSGRPITATTGTRGRAFSVSCIRQQEAWKISPWLLLW